MYRNIDKLTKEKFFMIYFGIDICLPKIAVFYDAVKFFLTNDRFRQFFPEIAEPIQCCQYIAYAFDDFDFFKIFRFFLNFSILFFL